MGGWACGHVMQFGTLMCVLRGELTYMSIGVDVYVLYLRVLRVFLRVRMCMFECESVGCVSLSVNLWVCGEGVGAGGWGALVCSAGG